MLGVIKWGLWERRWSIFWWSMGIVAFIVLNLVFYPTIRDQAAEFEKSLAGIPESARSFLSDTGEFVSPAGYLSSQIYYLLLPLLLGILAINLGNSLIGKEEREKTIELLLSRPISRSKLLFAKLIVGIIVLTIVGSVSTLSVVIMAKIVDIQLSSINIIMASFASLVLSATFGAVALAITLWGKKARVASIGIATVVALGGYVLVSLIGLASWLKWPSRLLPFYYYKPAEILLGTYNWNNFLVIVAMLLIPVLISWFIFTKRDIN